MKINIKIIIFSILILLSIMLMAFTNPYVIYQGEKYYKCREYYIHDTLFEPAGFTIITRHEVFYDHFNCR